MKTRLHRQTAVGLEALAEEAPVGQPAVASSPPLQLGSDALGVAGQQPPEFLETGWVCALQLMREPLVSELIAKFAAPSVTNSFQLFGTPAHK